MNLDYEKQRDKYQSEIRAVQKQRDEACAELAAAREIMAFVQGRLTSPTNPSVACSESCDILGSFIDDGNTRLPLPVRRVVEEPRNVAALKPLVEWARLLLKQPDLNQTPENPELIDFIEQFGWLFPAEEEEPKS